MREPARGSTRARQLDRRVDFRALKEQHGLTYREMAEITGYHEGSLKQWGRPWGSDAKPLREHTLKRIRLALDAHARTAEPKLTSSA